MRTMLNLSVAGAIGVVARYELELLVPRRRLRPWPLSRVTAWWDLVAAETWGGMLREGAPPRPAPRSRSST
jgi:hypothetical protein